MKIQSVKLYTQNVLAQRKFYAGRLGLALHSQSDRHIEFKIGYTTLSFVESADFKPYHFAINIDSEREAEALHWLQTRVKLLPFQGKDLIDFSSWRAKAMYFYDADKNIVEFIARRDLAYDSGLEFGPGAMHEISEIGMPVTDIKAVYRHLHESAGLEIYDGNFERFCAVGGPQGLFIVIDKNKKDWFPNGDKADAADFEAVIEYRDRLAKIDFKNGDLTTSYLQPPAV